MIAGQRDPRALAQLAKGRARKKTAQLEEALRGFFTDHHAAILRMMLDNTDRISAQIAALDARIEKEIGPFSGQAARLAEIPGVDAVAAAERRHDPIPLGRASGVVGQVLPADPPVGR